MKNLTNQQEDTLRRNNVSRFGATGFFVEGKVFDEDTLEENFRKAISYKLIKNAVRKLYTCEQRRKIKMQQSIEDDGFMVMVKKYGVPTR